MKKILGTLLLILMILSVSSCDKINFGTNNDEDNIIIGTPDTDKIDDTIKADLTEVIDYVDNAVIGVTLKYKHKTEINGILVESTDVESIGSGIIYKRFDNYDTNNNLVGYTYYVMTNRHVVTGKNPSEYSYSCGVYLGDEDIEIDATLLGYDDKVDLALIKFNYHKKINTVEFGNSDNIKKGQYVFAVGNPDGFDYYGSVTYGIISGTERYISDDTDNDGINDFNGIYIQHDAAINPGNSGGGLFTTDGKFIGMNTLKIVKDEVEGMGFAIPANVIKSILENYLEKGIKIVRPRLGITGSEVRDLTPAIIAANNMKPLPNIYGKEAPYGLYVSDVTVGGSLYNSGVKKDDIILEFDGIKLTRMNILSAKLNSLTEYFVGTKVEIKYYSRSNNTIKAVTVTLK